jgi:hypothetical protein
VKFRGLEFKINIEIGRDLHQCHGNVIGFKSREKEDDN